MQICIAESRLKWSTQGVDLDWEEVRLFLVVAEHRTLSEAARRLGISQATASRRLTALEDRVGYPLFDRTVEGAEITTLGTRWLEPARRMAEWATELSDTADLANVKPAGVVRIMAPPSLAFDFVAPFARAVRERYPEITLQVLSRTGSLDLMRRDADIALQMQPPTQRELATVRTFTHYNDAFVSKAYAKKLKQPPKPADVNYIAWAPPFEQFPPNPQLAEMIPGFIPSFAADDFLVQLRAAEAGVGAIFMQKVRHRFNRDSPLVPLGLHLGPHAKGSFHVVCAKTALGVERIRAVAELLDQELADAERLSAEHYGLVK
jgi:DNA-binding transcriptional LysR family regulator